MNNDHLSIEEVLDEIHELGYINMKTGKLILPKFNVHTRERLPYFLRYLKDSKNEGEYLFTLYDAWFEHSNPSVNPIFVPASRELLQYYKGRGSAGEPGRFIKPYSLKDLFPYFSLPVLAFGKHIHTNELHTVQMPDYDFIRFKGYEELKKEIDRDDVEWEQKKNILFFRGGIHGFGYSEYDTSELATRKPRCQRKLLVDLSSSMKGDNKWLDAEPSYNTTKKTMLQYKYQLDVDGEVNAWSALAWKLYSKSVVFKVKSHYIQWYYKDLKEWIHYIPVKGDLSDLKEKYDWAVSHDEECKKIAEQGREFMKALTYESVLETYRIQ